MEDDASDIDGCVLEVQVVVLDVENEVEDVVLGVEER